MRANNIDVIYKAICKTLVTRGKYVNKTLELNNYKFELTDINNNILNVRNISKSYLFGELMWYLNERNDIDFIHKFSTFWSRISDDGVTCNSAYGDIIFKRHGFDQVEKVIELLNTDRNSRRAVINLNVPNPNVIETHDEICTIALQFYIRNDKLYCTTMMRSNDIWFGLPYDVAFFTELQKYIAHRTNCEYGSYTHYVVSLHVYEKDFNELFTVIRTYPKSKIKVDIEKAFEYRKEIEKALEDCKTPRETIIDLFDKYGIYKEVQYDNQK